MGFTDLPAEIQKHLESLVELIPEKNEDSLNQFADVWIKKETMFSEQISAVGMKSVDEADPASGSGLLVLTNSGSLLSLGPGTQERELEYASIKLRTDVPDIILDRIREPVDLISKGKPVRFHEGRINRTSPVYLLAVCPDDIPREEQAKRIREATIYLTNGFMKLNRSLHIDPASVPDQYTMKSMTRYVAKKNGMTATDVKKILDDFLYLIESGMSLGETVPLGRIGRFSVKRKEAQKARVLKHPSTGKEITVEAKPAVVVPRISFSSYIKGLLAELPSDNDTLVR